MLPKFKHSGRVDPTTFVMLPALIAGAAVMAWAYQWLVEVIPYIKARIFLPILLGGGIGSLAACISRLGKCRNPAVAAGCGGGAALVAVFVSHIVAFRQIVGAHQGVSIGQYIRFRAESGWAVGSGPAATGVFVYVLWIIEAVIVVGMAAAIARIPSGRPFCEECRAWADQTLLTRVFRTPSDAAVESIRKADELTKLLELPSRGSDVGGPLGKDEFTYRITACPTCGGAATLAVELRTFRLKHEKRTDVEEKRHFLHEHVLLAPSEVETVTELVEALTSIPKATAPPSAQLKHAV